MRYKSQYRSSMRTVRGAISKYRTPFRKAQAINSKNSERKYADTDTTSQNMPNTAVFIPLNQIVEGDDYNQRNGRKIFAESVSVRMTLTYGTAPSCARVMLVQDNMYSGTAPVAADLFDTGGATSGIVNSALAVQTEPGRFTIYFDQRIKINNYDFSDVPVDILQPLMQSYRYSGSGATSNYKKVLYLVLTSDQAAAAAPNANYFARFRFLDA